MLDRNPKAAIAVSMNSMCRGVLAAATLWMLCVAGPAWGQEGEASSTSAKANTAAGQAADETEQATTESAEEIADSEAASPSSDIEWLTDDLGRYRIVKLLKGIEGRHHMWIGEDRVQVTRGLRFDVVKHDETHLWVKAYEPSHKLLPPKPEKPLVDAAEQERIAVAYETEAGQVDRVQFFPFDSGLPRRGQWRNGFDVADMNADGHLDIVFGPARKSSPRPNIFLGNGEGRWATWRARYPSFPYDYGTAAVADFNGDGHQDIVFGMHLRGILVLIGDSKGLFRPWSRGIALEVPGHGGGGTSFSSTAIATVDWDGDGDQDFIALGEGPKGVRVMMEEGGDLQTANGPILFVNQGDGSWEHRGLASRTFGSSISVGDFNGDGRHDFLTASNSKSHDILNLGEKDGLWKTEYMTALRRGAFPYAVASRELTGDQQDEILVGYMNVENGVWRSGLDIFYGDRSGDWARRTLYAEEGRFGVYAMATGDIDGDGRIDVGMVNGRAEVRFFLGNEDGFFDEDLSRKGELGVPVEGCRGYYMRLIDLNGDGLDEVIVALSGEQTGLPGILDKPGCGGGGSIRAWSPRLIDEGSETSGADSAAASRK